MFGSSSTISTRAIYRSLPAANCPAADVAPGAPTGSVAHCRSGHGFSEDGGLAPARLHSRRGSRLSADVQAQVAGRRLQQAQDGSSEREVVVLQREQAAQVAAGGSWQRV